MVIVCPVKKIPTNPIRPQRCDEPGGRKELTCQKFRFRFRKVTDQRSDILWSTPRRARGQSNHLSRVTELFSRERMQSSAHPLDCLLSRDFLRFSG